MYLFTQPRILLEAKISDIIELDLLLTCRNNQLEERGFLLMAFRKEFNFISDKIMTQESLGRIFCSLSRYSEKNEEYCLALLVKYLIIVRK